LGKTAGDQVEFIVSSGNLADRIVYEIGAEEIKKIANV
jgi:hypothetical protein